MKRILVALTLMAASAFTWALPSESQVQAELNQGHGAQAESMMGEVVAAKPGSAKAHYVYAEILAHNGKFAQASEETRSAQRIDPAISFTQPEKFRAFEQLLAREQQRPSTRSGGGNDSLGNIAPAATAQQQNRSSGIPGWVWPVGIAAVGFFLWRGFSRSRNAGVTNGQGGGGTVGMPAQGFGPNGQSNGFGPNGPNGPAPGQMYPANSYGNGMAAPSAGSGLLRTGMAVGAGVAGGMLLDEALRGREGGGLGHAADAGSGSGAGAAPGGNDFSPINDAGNDLENRQVDFGNGANWDDGGGSVDLGSGGSGDDWT